MRLDSLPGIWKVRPGVGDIPSTRCPRRHVTPGPAGKDFGRNTYYGAKVIFRGGANDTYVATVPTLEYERSPRFADLIAGADVLRTTARLRCSMYDNALVPVVLANRLVSLADVPSSEILRRFARQEMHGTGR
jgi:hypothetical protein